jgi:thioester reductase-like protein
MLSSGYSQSKWVAEKLMSKASACGLSVLIYRLGLICGDSRSGACNPHDLYSLLFVGMMKMKCYPESAIHSRLNGLPVDFTAKSIVYLSRMEGDMYGNIYHVVDPDNKIEFQVIIDVMRNCGIELKSVSYDEWKLIMKTINDEKSPLQSIAEFFSESAFKQKDIVSAKQFCSAIRPLGSPSFDNNYVLKWLRFISHNIIRT